MAGHPDVAVRSEDSSEVYLVHQGRHDTERAGRVALLERVEDVLEHWEEETTQ